MILDLITILGIVGATLILVAFVLEQTKIWNSEMLKYDLVNLVGGVLLVYYGIKIKGYPFVVLNSIWTLVSLRSVIIIILRNNKSKK